jgi:Hint domain
VQYDSSTVHVHLNSGNVLEVTSGTSTYDIQLDSSHDYSGDTFEVQDDGNGGTLIIEDNTPCYYRGTRILTPRGEVPVEELVIGDTVVTLSGEAKPIRWIGRRAYDGRFIAGNRQVLPVHIAAGALFPGLPARDLWVSPGHALYLGGVLVACEHLINGATIVQVDEVEQVEYFHIELDTHDIVFAEATAAETFVDCDNRLMFSNGAEYARLYPEDDRPSWSYCAARLEADSPQLSPIRLALLERAEALGHVLDRDPDLHLIVDGEVIRPVRTTGSVYCFEIPPGGGAVWLASRTTIPAEVVTGSGDRRRLGVPVERLLLHDADLSIEVWHSHPELSDGFFYDEETLRWTEGLARLPDAWRRLFADGCTLEVHLFPSGLPYLVGAPAPSRSAAPPHVPQSRKRRAATVRRRRA